MGNPHLRVFNKNRGGNYCADKIHLQDRCPNQNHRTLAYDLCPAQSGSALLRNHSSCFLFPCSPHSHHIGLLLCPQISGSLPYSELFVLLVFCAYGCLGSFSFKRQLSFHFLRVVFPDPYLKLLPHPLLFVSFPHTSGSLSVV